MILPKGRSSVKIPEPVDRIERAMIIHMGVGHPLELVNLKDFAAIRQWASMQTPAMPRYAMADGEHLHVTAIPDQDYTLELVCSKVVVF